MFIPVELFSKQEHECIQNYPLAHGNALQTLNGAVMCTVKKCCSQRPIEYTEFLGGVLYKIGVSNIVADLFVLYITDRVAMIRLRLVGVNVAPGSPPPMEQLHQREIGFTLKRFMLRLDTEIKKHLRVGITYDDINPQPPPATEFDLVLHWRELYHSTMSNKQLALRINMPYQTFRNKLSEMQQSKRVPHDAPRDEEQGRKEKHTRS